MKLRQLRRALGALALGGAVASCGGKKKANLLEVCAGACELDDALARRDIESLSASECFGRCLGAPKVAKACAGRCEDSITLECGEYDDTSAPECVTQCISDSTVGTEECVKLNADLFNCVRNAGTASCLADGGVVYELDEIACHESGRKALTLGCAEPREQ